MDFPMAHLLVLASKRRAPWLALWSCVTIVGCSGSVARPPVAASASRAEISHLPGISGMEALDKRSYLLIHDARDAEGSRAGVWHLDRRPPVYEAATIDDAQLGDDRLDDLESMAAIPSKPGRFLVLESGAKRTDRRRLACVEFSPKPEPHLSLVATGEIGTATSQLANCEAMVCWQNADHLYVLIADRVGTADNRSRCAVVCGRLTISDNAELYFDTEAPELADAVSYIKSPAPSAHSWRACTDLYLDSERQLWAACAEDRGDAGPFRSIIYRVGVLRLSDARLLPDRTNLRIPCEGVKVEALATASIGGATMAFATDDERFGGIWRTLPPSAGDDSPAVADD
jgi:hypothetical protein